MCMYYTQIQHQIKFVKRKEKYTQKMRVTKLLAAGLRNIFDNEL